MGRLGKNPELKYTKKGTPVCTFSVAVNLWGNHPPRWKRVIVWEKQAELCTLYLKKGYEVFVKGSSELKSFKTKEGEIKQFEEVRAGLIGFTNLY